MSIRFMYKEGWLLDDDSILFEIPKLRERLVEFVPKPEDQGDRCLFVLVENSDKKIYLDLEAHTACNKFAPSFELTSSLRELKERFRKQSDHLGKQCYFPDPSEENSRYYLSNDGTRMFILCGIRTKDDKPLVPAKDVLELLDRLIGECEKISPSSSPLQPPPPPKPQAPPRPRKHRVVTVIAISAGIALTLAGIIWLWISQHH